MNKITGKLRIVTLKGGGCNLSVDLDPDTDYDKLMPVLFNMALHPVSISPAGFESETAPTDPLKRAQRACEVISQALLELSEGMEGVKQPELALTASEGEAFSEDDPRILEQSADFNQGNEPDQRESKEMRETRHYTPPEPRRIDGKGVPAPKGEEETTG